MPEFDWAFGVGTLIVGLLGALGIDGYRRGGKKADPAELMMASLKDNTERVSGLLEVIRSMITLFQSIDGHGRDTVQLLRDMLKESQITAAKDDVRHR